MGAARAFALLLGSERQVGIVKHQGWRFAAELKGHALEVALRGVLLDLAPCRRATSEGNLADPHVRCQKLPDLTATVDNIDGPRREALFDQRTKGKGTQGRLLRGFIDERVSSRQGGLVVSVSKMCL